MFSRALESVAPWTDRNMFENVEGCTFRDGASPSDVTAYATVRALLSRRIPEESTFRYKINNIIDADEAKSDPIPYVKASFDPDALENTIIISQYRNMGEGAVEELIRNLDDQFIRVFGGWEIPQKSNTFLEKYMKVRVFINKAKNAAVVFTERLNMSRWHLIQSVFPTFVPGLFTEIPLDQQEKQMLHALTMHGASTYLKEISALEEKYDIRAKKIASMIGGFEKRERENQVNRIRMEIDNINSQMERLMREYQNQIDLKENANVRLNGMIYAINQDDGDGELVKFFQGHKMLDVESVSGSRITFIVKTYFENFDPDQYETFRNNDRFIAASDSNGVFHDPENRKKFMDALIMDRKFKLLMCGVYVLDIRGSVDTISGYDFPPNCEDYYPNYHLNHHHCMGDYRRIIPDYLNRGDTIGAINACIESVKSINIAESDATFNPMMHQLFESRKKCFELPDGSHVSAVQALEWLQKQEAPQETAQEGEEHEAD